MPDRAQLEPMYDSRICSRSLAEVETCNVSFRGLLQLLSDKYELLSVENESFRKELATLRHCNYDHTAGENKEKLNQSDFAVASVENQEFARTESPDFETVVLRPLHQDAKEPDSLLRNTASTPPNSFFCGDLSRLPTPFAQPATEPPGCVVIDPQHPHEVRMHNSNIDDQLRQLSKISHSISDVGADILRDSTMVSMADTRTSPDFRWATMCEGILEQRRMSCLHQKWRVDLHISNSIRISTLTPVCAPRASGNQFTTTALDIGTPWWVIDPYSKYRVGWDIVSIVLCIHDMIVVPLRIAFIDRDESTGGTYQSFLRWIDGFTLCFWFFDIILAFCTGRPDRDGVVEMRPKIIARLYLKSWFCIDLLTVTVDLLSLVMSLAIASGGMRLGKTFTRILRATRLLRILRLQEVMVEIVGQVESEIFSTLIGVTKNLIVICFINHYFACIWYTLGYWTRLDGSWLSANELRGDGEHLRAYLMALHWTLAQSTVGSSDISPRTSLERAFACSVCLLGLVIVAFFLSTVSRALVHLQKVNAKQNEQEMLFRRFCSENTVPRSVAAHTRRLMRIRNHDSLRDRVHQGDIEALVLLPDSLRQQLFMHQFQQHLVKHPLLKRYADVSPAAIRQLCSTAVEEAFLLPGKPVFKGPVDKMVFVTSGVLRYDDTASVFAESTIYVRTGHWACEEALWSTAPILSGPFESVVPCQLILLLPKEFQTIGTANADVKHHLSRYGAMFIKKFNEASRDESYEGLLFNDYNDIKQMVSQVWPSFSKQNTFAPKLPQEAEFMRGSSGITDPPTA